MSQLDLLDGLTSDPSGPRPARAKAKASQAKSSAPTIQGICGPTVFASSVPDGPLSWWENRLRERLARIGSTEFVLTWRQKTTPCGRSISRLVPSTRRISDTASTGSPSPKKEWPSPTVAWADGGQTSRSGDRKDEMLIGALVRPPASASPWATPTVQDAENCAGPSQFERNSFALNVQAVMHEVAVSTPLPAQAAGTMKVGTTPQAHDVATSDTDRWGRYGTKHGGRDLNDEAAMVEMATWPTPNTRDHHSQGANHNPKAHSTGLATLIEKKGAAGMEATGPITNGGSEPTKKRGALSPDFVFWLMGFPAEYRSCALEAMRSWPSKRKKSSQP